MVGASGGTPPYNYSLDGFEFQANGQFLGLGAGDYRVIVEDSEGCQESIDLNIDQPQELIVDAGEDVEGILGFNVQLLTTVFPAFRDVRYEWTTSVAPIAYCDTCANPNFIATNSGMFYVKITDEDGCMDVDSVFLNVIKERPIYAPNAFSPNGDGANDRFTLYGGPAALQIEELKVFNRWGALIYSGGPFALGDETKGWDGRFKNETMGMDVFAYYAVVSFVDGEEVLFEGDISLIR